VESGNEIKSVIQAVRRHTRIPMGKIDTTTCGMSESVFERSEAVSQSMRLRLVFFAVVPPRWMTCVAPQGDPSL